MLERILEKLAESGIDLNFAPNLAGDLEFAFNMYGSTDTNEEILRLKSALHRKQTELIALRLKKVEPTLIVKQEHLKPVELAHVHSENAPDEKTFTLKEAMEFEKNLIFNTPLFDMGVKCPLCAQQVKLYRRSINQSMVAELVRLYKKTLQEPHKIYFHVNIDLHRPASASGIDKLRHWGLVEAKSGENSKTGGKHSGYWKILPKGIDFLEGRERVPKYIKTYDGAFFGFDESGTVGVGDCATTEFDYQELMSR